MPLGTTVIQEADKQVGTAESPPHSNCTPYIKEFGYPVCAAWCAMFVSCMLKRIFGRWVLKTASVWQARADAQAGKNGMKWHSKTSPIGVGWAALFDFGGRGDPGSFHISLVRAVGTWNLHPGSGSFQTDGGNESDAVRQQWRDGKYVIGFIEFPYEEHQDLPEVDMWTPQQIKEVTDSLHNVETMVGAVFGVAGRSEDAEVNTLTEQRLVDLKKAMDNLVVSGGQIDTDAFADKVADRIAARMKD